MRKLADYDQHADQQQELLDGVIKRLQQIPGVTVVLIESPLNPEFVGSWLTDGLYSDYLERIDALAATNNVAFCNLNSEAAYQAADFIDSYHLCSKDALARSRAALTTHLASALHTRVISTKGN